MLRHMIFVVSVAWAAFSCIGWTFVFPSNMLSDDLHFVPLSLSPMIKKTPGDAVMLRLIHCPLNQFIDVEFYAQRNSQDTTSHQNEAKYKFCHVWSGRPGENGQWHRTSQFFFFSLSLSTILKECDLLYSSSQSFLMSVLSNSWKWGPIL